MLYLGIISAIVSYLLGSISFARIVTYIWTSGKDITDHEIPVDGTDESYKVLSIGANSVSSLLGARVGTIVSIFDILKVFLPTLFFKLSYPEQPALHLIAATFGLIGHIWPIYYRFHGGSGFTAIMGGLLSSSHPSLVFSWGWLYFATWLLPLCRGSGCSSHGFGGVQTAVGNTFSTALPSTYYLYWQWSLKYKM